MNTATTHKLHNVTARRRLAVRRKPYYVTVESRLTLGYLRRPGQAVGSWIARREIGRRESHGTSQYAYPIYEQWTLGAADDLVPADGVTLLSFNQAMSKAAAEHHAKQTGMPSTALTVREAITQYLMFVGRRKGEGARADGAHKLGKHVLHHPIADLKVNDLTTEHLEEWQAGLVKTTEGPEIARRSKDTANRILASLKASLNYAWGIKANGILSDQAWRKLKRFEKVAQPRVHHFSMTELRALIAHASPPAFQNLLMAAYLVGARYGELRTVDVGHLMATRSQLYIPAGKTGPRWVTLTPEGVTLFARLAHGRAAEEPLLLAPHGGRWRDGQQKHLMERALKNAGLYRLDELGRPPTFYGLRHSHISRLRQKGAPDWLIGENTGTSVQMISATYGKLTPDERRAMIEQFTPPLREAVDASA